MNEEDMNNLPEAVFLKAFCSDHFGFELIYLK